MMPICPSDSWRNEQDALFKCFLIKCIVFHFNVLRLLYAEMQTFKRNGHTITL